MLSENIADCPRLKVLRLEENCLQVQAVPTRLLTHSKVSLLAIEGNLFESKDLRAREGYEKVHLSAVLFIFTPNICNICLD